MSKLPKKQQSQNTEFGTAKFSGKVDFAVN
jgi:hypothetical protein